MTQALNIIYRLSMALLNRARGSKLFGLTNSTNEARMASTLAMSILTNILHPVASPDLMGWHVLVLWGLLMIWTPFGWMKYEMSAVGGPVDMTQPCFRPVDWLLRHWTPAYVEGSLNLSYRLWGCVGMGLRHCLLVPAVIVSAFLTHQPGHLLMSLFTPLLGLPYLPAGFLRGSLSKYAVMVADLAVGLGLSYLLC